MSSNFQSFKEDSTNIINFNSTKQEPVKRSIFGIRALETLLLLILVISFISCRFVPSLNENIILQKYMQIYTAFFVCLECIIKFYNMYADISSKKNNLQPNSNEKNAKSAIDHQNTVFWIKMIVFLVAFGIAIQGLIPIKFKSIKDTVPSDTEGSLTALLLATGMGIFPFSFSDILMINFENVYKNFDFVFNLIYFGTLIVGGTLYLFGINVLGTMLIIQLLIKSIELILRFYISNKETRNVQNVKYSKVYFYLLCVMSFAIALGVFIIYFRNIELGFFELWKFWKSFIGSINKSEET